MPPSPINASAAALVHTLVPLTPAALTLLQPEDYLLIHRCRDASSRQVRRKLNLNGDCYARIDYDFVQRYEIDAEILSPYGLADWHPGANLSIMKNGIPTLAFANADRCFGGFGGQLIYTDPVRERLPGDIPGISFTVIREFATIDAPAGFGLPAPASIALVSYPPSTVTSGEDFGTLYGFRSLSARELNLTGPEGTELCTGAIEYLVSPATAGSAPATLGAFTTGIDPRPEVTGENEITEVLSALGAGGTYLFSTTGSGILLETLRESGFIYPTGGGTVGGTFNSGQPLGDGILWFAEQDLIGGGNPLHYTATTPGLLTYADFLAAHPPETGYLYTGIYSVEQATWLTIP